MGGACVSFLRDEGQDRILATYRNNYQRLAAAKHRYDDPGQRRPRSTSSPPPQREQHEQEAAMAGKAVSA